MPALLLVWHASEGDNTEDARTLATAAARTLEKLHGGSAEGRPSGTGGGQAWAMPRSWGTALYGTPRVAY